MNVWRSDYVDYKPIDLDNLESVLLNRTSWTVSTYGGFGSGVAPEKDWLQGDGVMMYAADGGKPIGSIRLENVRDGLEDIALLYQLQQARQAGQESKHSSLVQGVAALTRPLVENQTSFSRRPSRLEQYRQHILETLELSQGAI